jgi:hypothetical protein
MVLTQTRTFPFHAIIAIWSLRLVPMAIWLLMFLFDSGSSKTPILDSRFWYDTIAICGIVTIISLWNYCQQIKIRISIAVYLSVFLCLILRDPYGVITKHLRADISIDIDRSLSHSLWFGFWMLLLGIATEVLVHYLRKYRPWAWWLSFALSLFYVATVLFFFQGCLGIWSLLKNDTKRAFGIRLKF